MDPKQEDQRIAELEGEALARLFAGDTEGAASVFESVLALNPDSLIANTMGTQCLALQGRLDEAEQLARNAVQMYPRAAYPHMLLSCILTDKNQHDEAESEMWAAVATEPDNAKMRWELARLLQARGNITESIAQLKRVVELSPDDTRAVKRLVGQLLQEGRVQEARVEADRAWELLRAEAEDDEDLSNRLDEE